MGKVKLLPPEGPGHGAFDLQLQIRGLNRGPHGQRAALLEKFGKGPGAEGRMEGRLVQGPGQGGRNRMPRLDAHLGIRHNQRQRFGHQLAGIGHPGR